MATTSPTDPNDIVGVVLINPVLNPTITRYLFRVTWPEGSSLNDGLPTLENGILTYSYNSGPKDASLVAQIFCFDQQMAANSFTEAVFENQSREKKKGSTTNPTTKTLPVVGSAEADADASPVSSNDIRNFVLQSNDSARAKFVVALLRVSKSWGKDLTLALNPNISTQIVVSIDQSPAISPENVVAVGIIPVVSPNPNSICLSTDLDTSLPVDVNDCTPI